MKLLNVGLLNLNDMLYTVLEIRQMRKVSDGQPCNQFLLRCQPIEDFMKKKYMDVHGQPQVWTEVVRQFFEVSGQDARTTT